VATAKDYVADVTRAIRGNEIHPPKVATLTTSHAAFLLAAMIEACLDPWTPSNAPPLCPVSQSWCRAHRRSPPHRWKAKLVTGGYLNQRPVLNELAWELPQADDPRKQMNSPECSLRESRMVPSAIRYEHM